MNSVLSGLGVTSAPAAEPAPVAGDTPPSSGSSFDKMPVKPLLVLKSIAEGQIPGAYVPADAPKIPSSLTPGALAGVGVGIYRPQTPGVIGVLFNKNKFDLGTLQKLDQSGQLTEVFPPVTALMGDVTSGPDEQAPEPGTAEAPSAVPVLPRPTFTADASKHAALLRQKMLTGEDPSERPIPGGGAILNGLLTRPV